MDEKNKISVSQLLILLTLSRFFSLVAYSPQAQKGGENITLLTTLASGVLQYLALMAGLKLSRRGTGLSPLLAPGGAFFRFQSAIYWIFSIVMCAYSSAGFISFMVTAIYDYRYSWVVAVTFVGAGALAVSQGLEGLARGGGILMVFLGIGAGVIALGLWSQYDWLNFSPRLLSLRESFWGTWQAFAMNGEMLALLLLLSHVRGEPRAASCAGWVGAVTAGSVAVQLMTMLTLGAYGAIKPYPVFTAVTSAGFQVFQRLDSVFLVIWVVLGLIRLSVFLALASSLSAGAFFRPWSSRWVWGNALLAGAGAMMLFGRMEWMEILHRVLATGLLTVVGVLVLPGLGWLLDAGRRKKG
jgi:hypothetical protein